MLTFRSCSCTLSPPRQSTTLRFDSCRLSSGWIVNVLSCVPKALSWTVLCHIHQLCSHGSPPKSATTACPSSYSRILWLERIISCIIGEDFEFISDTNHTWCQCVISAAVTCWGPCEWWAGWGCAGTPCPWPRRWRWWAWTAGRWACPLTHH